MYQYLEGKIVDIQPTYIVVDVHGVGYLVRVGNPFRFEVGSDDVRVYVHQSISDSAQILYGFNTLKEKQLFEKLLAVSGIGAKSALAILANGDQQAIVNAISGNDVSYLTKFPGIGKKTAQQIVLDLRDKLEDFAETDLFQTATVNGGDGENKALNEAMAALAALGYRDRDVKKVEKVLAEQPGETTDVYLSSALSLLTK
ncbi:Holliday junction branch migration protein RuvA [Secundilactobacillus muriivasis]|jgi:Holliday junction DNA helicase RuvA